MFFTIWLRSQAEPLVGMIMKPDPAAPGGTSTVESYEELIQLLMGPNPPTFLAVYGGNENQREEWIISISEIKWIGPELIKTKAPDTSTSRYQFKYKFANEK